MKQKVKNTPLADDDSENDAAAGRGFFVRGQSRDRSIRAIPFPAVLTYPPQRTDPTANVEIILYDRTPGGAGFVEEGKTRWNEVLAAAIDICQTTPNHVCEEACYDCLKDFGNQSFHDKLDRQSVLRFFGVGS